MTSDNRPNEISVLLTSSETMIKLHRDPNSPPLMACHSSLRYNLSALEAMTLDCLNAFRDLADPQIEFSPTSLLHLLDDIFLKCT